MGSRQWTPVHAIYDHTDRHQLILNEPYIAYTTLLWVTLFRFVSERNRLDAARLQQAIESLPLTKRAATVRGDESRGG